MTKELNKGFTGIEINGVQFSNIREMLIYMDKQRKRIVDLEKEIAELKESVAKFSKNGLDFLHSIESNRNCIDCEHKTNIQLTKAKEHIRTLISCLIDWVQEGDKDYCHIAEAEQFISEVEK